MGSRKTLRRQTSKQNLMLENLPPIIKQVQFKCKEPGCNGRFKRQEHLKRHMKSHSKEKPHVCWVPGCHRAFSRSDNLNAHYTKTHSKRGGRNRYVATLDENSPDYDPDFRGQLTPDGRPIYGSKLEDAIPGAGDMGLDAWDE
jgi:zinc finger protein BrlA